MKHALVAAFILTASAMSVQSAIAAPREPDAPTWLWGLLGLKEPSGKGIAARNRGYAPPSPPSTKTEPVYNGLGAGTDNGQYISDPRQQTDRR